MDKEMKEYVGFLDSTADRIRGHPRNWLKVVHLYLWAIVATIGFLILGLGDIYDEVFGTFKMTVSVFDTSSQENIHNAYRLQRRHGEFRVIMLYSSDSSKTWERWKSKIGMLENTGSYGRSPQRPASRYLGLYQIDSLMLPRLGITVTAEEFLRTPELQEAAFVLLTRRNADTMRPYIKRYCNKVFAGYHITESGILALTHRVGASETSRFFDENGLYVPCDANGPALNYLSLGGYDLSCVINQ